MSNWPKWPNREDLVALRREAAEHRRVWGIVSGLSSTLLTLHDKHSLAPDERVHKLEAKIVAQREAIKTIEECRAFETETEHHLAAGLQRIQAMTANDVDLQDVIGELDAILADYVTRKGPRPGTGNTNTIDYDPSLLHQMGNILADAPGLAERLAEPDANSVIVDVFDLEPLVEHDGD